MNNGCMIQQKHSAIKTLKKKLLHRVGTAIADFSMIRDGDKIMVCLSGGKDSFVLLTLLRDLQIRAPVRFELLAALLNQRGDVFPEHAIATYLEHIGQPYVIIRKATYDIVRSKLAPGQAACALCSRLRRGILYTEARARGCTKIALGHHADDIIETFLLNILFNGTLKAMPPVLVSDDGTNTVIRPLAYCREDEIDTFATLMRYPTVPPQVCGLPINPQRGRVKALLKTLERDVPGVRASMLAALRHIVPSHLLDPELFDNVNRIGSKKEKSCAEQRSTAC
ncbi:MAG: tRNA 2-thiocytidine(32) synthetase TtcA [Desulfobacterota bacterium]|nr:tRNA 2-thiocytidine(32) synthetase TtcA [Thermodesulfobacteriota bacterium]